MEFSQELENRNRKCRRVLMPWNEDVTIRYTENGEDRFINKWELIQLKLNKELHNVDDIIDVIRSYNAGFDEDGSPSTPAWSFIVLRQFVEKMDTSEKELFFGPNGILRSIQNLILKSKHIIHNDINWLISEVRAEFTLHQLQIACILANAFFCTFATRTKGLPTINFIQLFEGSGGKRLQCKIEKLKCLLHYFGRIHRQQPSGFVTFRRLVIPDNKYPRWDRQTTRISDLTVFSDGKIEDQSNHLQADFANRFIGGGVLNTGCVQEEIRFVICPELIAVRLFTEALLDNEAMIIIGAERYSNYTGYSDDFRFDGDHIDTTPSDEMKRKNTYILAVDALRFTKPDEQYRERHLLREIKKIYTGLKPTPGEPLLPFATGNWGCGAFRGNAELKALLQLIAASEAQRPLVYFTFGNDELRDGLRCCHTKLCRNGVTIGQLYRVLARYSRNRRPGQSVFQYVDFEVPRTIENDARDDAARMARSEMFSIPRSSSLENVKQPATYSSFIPRSKVSWNTALLSKKPLTISESSFYSNSAKEGLCNIRQSPSSDDLQATGVLEESADSEGPIPASPPDEKYTSFNIKPKAAVQNYEIKKPVKRKDLAPWARNPLTLKKHSNVCDNDGKRSLTNALMIQKAMNHQSETNMNNPEEVGPLKSSFFVENEKNPLKSNQSDKQLQKHHSQLIFDALYNDSQSDLEEGEVIPESSEIQYKGPQQLSFDDMHVNISLGDGQKEREIHMDIDNSDRLESTNSPLKDYPYKQFFTDDEEKSNDCNSAPDRDVSNFEQVSNMEVLEDFTSGHQNCDITCTSCDQRIETNTSRTDNVILTKNLNVKGSIRTSDISQYFQRTTPSTLNNSSWKETGDPESVVCSPTAAPSNQNNADLLATLDYKSPCLENKQSTPTNNKRLSQPKMDAFIIRAKKK